MQLISAPYNVRYFIRMIIGVVVLLIGCIIALSKGYARSVEMGVLLGAAWAALDRVLTLTTHKRLDYATSPFLASMLFRATAIGLLSVGYLLFGNVNSAQFFVFLLGLLLPILSYLCWAVLATARKDPSYWKR